jgi:hypothetical protein
MQRKDRARGGGKINENNMEICWLYTEDGSLVSG